MIEHYTTEPPVEQVELSRAQQVEEVIRQVRQSYEANFFDLCDLLAEVHHNKYYISYGYSTFDEWIERGGVEISSRQGYYCVRIAVIAQTLGITKAQLIAAKISKLREIFTLNVAEYADEIRALVIEAPTITINDVRAKVAALKSKNPSVYITLRLTPETKVTLDEAIELARRLHGDTIGLDGKVADISDSKAVELIAEEFVQSHQEDL